ncbi:MAG: hypothetical protein J6U54_15945 [Clostridiales bacterium]|nr:hypothetical protein [Clostridiales bacterium]
MNVSVVKYDGINWNGQLIPLNISECWNWLITKGWIEDVDKFKKTQGKYYTYYKISVIGYRWKDVISSANIDEYYVAYDYSNICKVIINFALKALLMNLSYEEAEIHWTVDDYGGTRCVDVIKLSGGELVRQTF